MQQHICVDENLFKTQNLLNVYMGDRRTKNSNWKTVPI